MLPQDSRWRAFPNVRSAHVRLLPQVPETLIGALTELEQEYTKAMKDPDFKVRLSALLANASAVPSRHLLQGCDEAFCSLQANLAAILKDYVGRESPLYHAERLSEHYRQ